MTETPISPSQRGRQNMETKVQGVPTLTRRQWVRMINHLSAEELGNADAEILAIRDRWRDYLLASGSITAEMLAEDGK